MLQEGETLQERLRAGALPVRTVTEIATQIVLGLAATYEGGIVQRDLKPANLFITRDGHINIMDFGIAKLAAPVPSGEWAETAAVAGETGAGTALGTVGYASPEQLRGQPVDHRTDLFSFGCVL